MKNEMLIETNSNLCSHFTIADKLAKKMAEPF